AGFRFVEPFRREAPGGSTIHEMGTARMGRDPKTSVLNGFNQMHAVPNVFVTDGSCMTSSSSQNPSLTYMALTARACNYAVALLKQGKLYTYPIVNGNQSLYAPKHQARCKRTGVPVPPGGAGLRHRRVWIVQPAICTVWNGLPSGQCHRRGDRYPDELFFIPRICVSAEQICDRH